jgi:small-conductance mechanosensitive channel
MSDRAERGGVRARAGAFGLLLLLFVGGLQAAEPRPGVGRLDTPQAALEGFLDAGRRGDFDAAATVLDPEAAGADPAWRALRARQLYAVLTEQTSIPWDQIPDAPDGGPAKAGAKGEGGTDAATASLLVERLYVGDRDVEIRLERRPGADGRPAWRFAPRTVAQIPALHDAFGPRPFERRLPAFLRQRLLGVAVWQWAGFAGTLALGGLLGWIVQRLLNALIRRTSWRWGHAVAGALRGPGVLAFGLGVLYWVSRRHLGLGRPLLNVLEPLYAALLAVSLAWFLQRLVSRCAQEACSLFESRNSDEANVIVTRIAVARHLIVLGILVGGVLYALSRFAWFREFGTTLLASAGILGLVVGVAAQRVLGNLFAGLVLGITQPVKTGDAILFEDEFGWIEEISLTYLVIRTWDLRRVVVPISYFMDKPVQNWSRRSQQIIQPVYVHADYTLDMEAARTALAEILERCEDWDRIVPPMLEVTEVLDRTVQLRALCSASDPGASWRLRCQVREGLVAFLRDHEAGRYLPRTREDLIVRPDGHPARDGNGNGHPKGLAEAVG